MPTDSIVTCAAAKASITPPLDFHGGCRQTEVQEQMQAGCNGRPRAGQANEESECITQVHSRSKSRS